MPYDELGGERSMEPRHHPDRRFLWLQRRMAYRRIVVRAVDAALRVLESDEDDRRTRITARWRRFVLTAAAEAVDAAAERAALWMQLHGYSTAAAACVALRPPVRDVEELECHTHAGGSAPGASSSSSTQAAVRVAEPAAVGREQPRTQEITFGWWVADY